MQQPKKSTSIDSKNIPFIREHAGQCLQKSSKLNKRTVLAAVLRRLRWIARPMAIKLTYKIEAAGSRRAGEIMVILFFRGCCLLLLLFLLHVCSRDGWY